MNRPRLRRRASSALFAALLAASMAPCPLAAVELVSGIDDPALLSASANGPSERPTYFAVDAAGRRVVFQSTAANLAPGDVNKADDIFVRDLLLGITVCASSDSGGTVGNGSSRSGAVSRDGRFVAYESAASNLVADDTNATSDIFVKDLQTGVTTRVSTSDSGAQANGSSWKPALSADGRYVVFESYATNLAVPDGNTSKDIFVKDLQTGAVARASTSAAGSAANNTSSAPSISADGRYVVFSSYASNLVAGDTNATSDVFRKDLQTGELLRVSTDGGGVQASGRSDMATINADGRYVSFASYAANLVPGDTNGLCDVFVKDLQSGSTNRVSTDGSGAQANGFSYNYGISDDGRHVVLQTAATNLIAGEAAGGPIRKDLLAGTTARVNTAANGVLVTEFRLSRDQRRRPLRRLPQQDGRGGGRRQRRGGRLPEGPADGRCLPGLGARSRGSRVLRRFRRQRQGPRLDQRRRPVRRLHEPGAKPRRRRHQRLRRSLPLLRGRLRQGPGAWALPTG